MKIKAILLALGLSVLALSASASVTSLGTTDSDLTFGDNVAVGKAAGAKLNFTDVFTFTLDASVSKWYTLDDIAYVTAGTFAAPGLTLSLYKGTYTSASSLASPIGSLTFDSAFPGDSVSFGTLAAGNYYYVVTGTSVAVAVPGSKKLFYPDSYGVQATATAVPEPASVAMLLAGIGMLGFTASRRKNGSV